MVVCVCRYITEDQFNESFRQTNSLEKTIDELGVGEGCRRCLDFISEEYQQVQGVNDNS